MKRKSCFKLFFLVLFLFVEFIYCKRDFGTPPKDDNFDIEINNWTVYNFENTGILSNDTRRLIFDKDNNLWVGTFYNGLFKYNGSEWVNYTVQNSKLPNNTIASLAVDNNNHLWIGTNDGLVNIKGQDWFVYDTTNSPLPYHVVSSIAVDKNNLLWIGCGHATDGGLLTFDGTKWKTFLLGETLLPCSVIHFIHVDNYNNKWVGMGVCAMNQGGAGLIKITTKGNWQIYKKSESELLYTSVDALAIDSRGCIWVGYKAWIYLEYDYYHGGLQKYDGKTWYDYRPHPNGQYNPSAIVSNRVSHIVNDQNNLLWIVTEAEGNYPYYLSIFRNGMWKNISDVIENYPFNIFIRDIILNDNKVWLATERGVICFDYYIK